MAVVPASIRNNNPGAMYPGKSSRKFGSSITNTIGGGHSIAQFPSPINGAAALFDLLYRVYAGKTLEDAIATWAWGKSYSRLLSEAPDKAKNVDTYLSVIKDRAGYDRDIELTRDFITDPETVVPLAKAMAWHEAGRAFPLSDEDWVKAHALALPKEEDWLGKPYELARTFIGTKEIPGKQDNLEIMRWYVDAGHPEIEHDETPNCAAFVCSTLERTGMSNPKTLTARDFLKYGEELAEPVVGCIGVMWRVSPTSWEGHVGYVAEIKDNKIKLLGANQGNETNESWYVRSRFLGFRKPIPGKKPALKTVQDSRTLQALINSIATIVVGVTVTLKDYIVSAAHTVAGVFSSAPDVVTQAETAVSTGQRLTTLLNVAWPLAASTAITLVILVYLLGRGFIERREQ